MWGEMRAAMRAGLELPNEKELRSDLLGPLYSYTNKQQIILEKKSDMKKRGLASPDHADAVALTFAQPVIKETAYPKGFQSPFTHSIGFV
jgi:phage terminase large subunit